MIKNDDEISREKTETEFWILKKIDRERDWDWERNK